MEIGKIQNYITKPTKKLTEESAKKSLIDEISNKLLRLEFKSNNSIKTKCLKYVVKNTAYIIKMKLRTYCLACRKHANYITSRKVTMTNKVIRDKSRCGECLSHKSRFMKQKLDKKVVINFIKQTCWLIV